MAEKVRIVVDAMGGDNAPVEPVKAAVQAVTESRDIEILLTGQQDVIEKELKKYTVETVREGDVFVVTNTYGGNSPGGSADPTLPQTGQLWWPVPVMIAAGMLFVAVGLIRRRGNGNEK